MGLKRQCLAKAETAVVSEEITLTPLTTLTKWARVAILKCSLQYSRVVEVLLTSWKRAVRRY